MKKSILAVLAALAAGLCACASQNGNGNFLSDLGHGATDAAKQATQNTVNQKVSDTTTNLLNK